MRAPSRPFISARPRPPPSTLTVQPTRAIGESVSFAVNVAAAVTPAWFPLFCRDPISVLVQQAFPSWSPVADGPRGRV